MTARIVMAFYNLGVLLIATGTFKEGTDFSIGIFSGTFFMVCGFLIDWLSEKEGE